jgi:hypothetical protein
MKRSLVLAWILVDGCCMGGALPAPPLAITPPAGQSALAIEGAEGVTTMDVVVLPGFPDPLHPDPAPVQRFHLTSADQWFVVASIAPGPFELSVFTSDGRGGRASGTLVPNQLTSARPPIRGGVALTGHVVDEVTGAPITGAMLLANGETSGRDISFGPMLPFATSADDGTFALGGVCGEGVERASTRTIQVARAGYSTRYIRLPYPESCGVVTHVAWQVSLRPLAETVLEIDEGGVVTRVDPRSFPALSGLRVGDRMVGLATARADEPLGDPYPQDDMQHVQQYFDAASIDGAVVVFRVIGADGAQRDLRVEVPSSISEAP